MPAPEPPPLNDLEHLLVASASTPHDHALGQRFAQAVLRTSMGVAGTLHPGHEFTPFLVGTTARHHVVAFTHPVRFQRFAEAVRLDPQIQTQPLTGHDAFERLVPSGIPLLINPQSSTGRELSVPQMVDLLRGGIGAPVAQTNPTAVAETAPVATSRWVGPPAYVVPGLYERLAHYFDWLGQVDEAVLLWSREADGREGYLLRVRTQLPPPRVLNDLGRALGNLQGRRLDARVYGWAEPPWTDGVAPFYRRR